MTLVRTRRLLIGIAPSLLLTGLLTGAAAPRAGAVAPPVSLKWARNLGGEAHESSPVLANLDGRPSAVFGAWDGRVYAIHADGTDVPGWPAATTNAIQSSPAVADTNNDGQQEVFVGVGTAAAPGGALYSFTHTGGVRWRFNESAPTQPSLAIHASPALGDINSDNAPDVTAGALGLQMYSLSEGGAVNGGWPFYTDDTVFSSPALADVNGDGVTDIITGGDASPGGPTDHQGGVLRAIDGGGHEIWKYFIDEIIYSSPAVGDVDGDGAPDIVFGAGDYWAKNCGCTNDSTKIFVLNMNGTLKFSYNLGGRTLGSPALADVNGDGRLDIIEATYGGANDKKLFVIDGSTRNPLAQFNNKPIDSALSITTADLNGDAKQDLVVPTGSGVYAYDGATGGLLFSMDVGKYSFQSAPLIADLDGNGLLDIVITGTNPTNKQGVAERWEVANPAARIGSRAWPMFHKDSRHTGSWTNPPLRQTFCPASGGGGYWMVASDGGIFSFCDALFHGSTGAIHLNKPIVGMAATPSGSGYWLVASDGGIFGFGDAQFYGSTGGIALNQPIVGMAATPSGHGYWLVARDGGVFGFGDAQFRGSTGGIHLNQPIVGMAASRSGGGYLLVASDGGIFAFGDAVFRGSTGAIHLNQPIVGMAPTGSGGGYWLVASDGGIFAFGDAVFRGSTGAIHLNQPIVGMQRTPAGDGYWLVASDGGIFAFNAPFFGSAGAIHLNSPIVGMAAPHA